MRRKTARMQRFAAAACVGLVGVGGWLSARPDARAARDHAAAARAVAPRLLPNEEASRVRAAHDKIERLAAALPPASAWPGRVAELRRLAEAHGLEVEACDAVPWCEPPDGGPRPVYVAVVGPFDEVAAFVADVESSAALTRIESLRLHNLGTADSRVRAELRLALPADRPGGATGPIDAASALAAVEAIDLPAPPLLSFPPLAFAHPAAGDAGAGDRGLRADAAALRLAATLPGVPTRATIGGVAHAAGDRLPGGFVVSGVRHGEADVRRDGREFTLIAP